MEMSAFQPDFRYLVALQDGATVRPAAFYVHRVYGDFMVVRTTRGDGLLRKIRYGDVQRIVSATAVEPALRLLAPAALLDEKTWRDRDALEHYGSSPAKGK